MSGLSIDELSAIRNRNIGFVFHAFHLLPKTSAVENVEPHLLYSNRTDISNLLLNALKAVGLKNSDRHHPNEFSGEQQRVAYCQSFGERT
ncbi:MAG: hypothetical protein JKY42_02115 [Flavobacteriales bacterium]|nr:hypothetical protein [Flavobacteriales bacterium]